MPCFPIYFGGEVKALLLTNRFPQQRETSSSPYPTWLSLDLIYYRKHVAACKQISCSSL